MDTNTNINTWTQTQKREYSKRNTQAEHEYKHTNMGAPDFLSGRIVKNFTIRSRAGYYKISGRTSGYLFDSLFYKNLLSDDIKERKSSWSVVSF